MKLVKLWVPAAIVAVAVLAAGCGTKCAPANCSSGCCDPDGLCVIGNVVSACGSGGNACTPCNSATQTCSLGTCQNINSGSCNANNCAGCCNNGSCIVTASETTNQCGTTAGNGAACVSCTGTQTCTGGVCAGGASCNSSNCATGCCNGTVCVTNESNTICGTGGQACADCTVTGGTCSSTGHVCQGGTCTNSNCSGGCCQGGTCVTQSNSACGLGGAACSNCALLSETCNITSGTCVSGTACNSNNCSSGCCAGGPTGTCVLFSEESNSQCGSGGNTCQNCTASSQVCNTTDWTCQTTATCNSANCSNGCCSGTTCIPAAQETTNACGLHGVACASCTGGATCNSGVCGAGTACFRAALVASIGENACAVDTGGSVYCWGDNDDQQVGVGSTTDALLPTLIPGLQGARQLIIDPPAGGGSVWGSVCAVKSDGTVWCQGLVPLGLNMPTSASCADGPCAPTAVQVQSLQNVAQLAYGWYHGCAVLTDGSVECWGANHSGELGAGAPVDCTTLPCPLHAPAPVPGVSGAVKVALGRYLSCALLSSGSVKCWGTNLGGELATGTQECTPHATPVTVPNLSGVTALTVSGGAGNLLCAVSGGTAFCWGDNSRALLNINPQIINCSDTCSSSQFGCEVTTTPTALSGISGAIDVQFGGADACVVKSGGTVSCWGNNPYEVGLSTISSSPTTLAAPAGAAQMSMGGVSSCLVYPDGSIQCAGLNPSGQLGVGTSDRGGGGCDDSGANCPLHGWAMALGSGC